MNIYAALALCFAPLLIIFLSIRRFAHVGIIAMLYAALLGLLAVAPISILQFYVADISFLQSDHWITQLLRAILFNGLIEAAVARKIFFMRLHLRHEFGLFRIGDLFFTASPAGKYDRRAPHIRPNV